MRAPRPDRMRRKISEISTLEMIEAHLPLVEHGYKPTGPLWQRRPKVWEEYAKLARDGNSIKMPEFGHWLTHETTRKSWSWNDLVENLVA